MSLIGRRRKREGGSLINASKTGLTNSLLRIFWSYHLNHDFEVEHLGFKKKIKFPQMIHKHVLLKICAKK